MLEPFPWRWLQKQLADAAAEGVYVGTSSWKYPGWLGSVYDPQRYLHRGRLSTKRFEEQCLEEYALLFPTVCLDSGYYQFPVAERLLPMAAQVPPTFRFTTKVTADLTLKRFPNLPRFGPRAGTLNPNFLNSELFHSAFLEPFSAIREQTGLIIFEFSQFHSTEFARGRDFLEVLDPFLGQLPSGWDFGVEIRNANFLHPDYFALLASHRVAHVYNSWSAMPPLQEQWEMPGSLTWPDCTGARLLLKPGRKYQDAVDAFQPYESIQDPQPELRDSLARLILSRRSQRPCRKTWLYVNNRLEGNAPRTIAEVMALVAAQAGAPDALPPRDSPPEFTGMLPL